MDKITKRYGEYQGTIYEIVGYGYCRFCTPGNESLYEGNVLCFQLKPLIRTNPKSITTTTTYHVSGDAVSHTATYYPNSSFYVEETSVTEIEDPSTIEALNVLYNL